MTDRDQRAARLDLDDIVDLSQLIQEVIGRPLRPEESSRLNSLTGPPTQHQAISMTAGVSDPDCPTLFRTDRPVAFYATEALPTPTAAAPVTCHCRSNLSDCATAIVPTIELKPSQADPAPRGLTLRAITTRVVDLSAQLSDLSRE